MASEKRGIDVSYAQGAVDWAAVKACGQVDFAMIRTGYGWGDGQEDREFRANVRGCEAQGIPYGVFHYSYATTAAQAKEEAAATLNILRGAKPSWPVALDFEEAGQLSLPRSEQLDIIDAFLGELERAGYFGMLYMSASSLERLYRFAPERVKKYAVWVAHVRTNRPGTACPWGIWQHSWSGNIPGIAGDVDLDSARVDYASIILSGGFNGWGKPPEQGGKTLSWEELKTLLLGMGVEKIGVEDGAVNND